MCAEHKADYKAIHKNTASCVKCGFKAHVANGAFRQGNGCTDSEAGSYVFLRGDAVRVLCCGGAGRGVPSSDPSQTPEQLEHINKKRLKFK